MKGDLAVPALNANEAGLELKPVVVPARFGTEEGAAVVDNTGIIGFCGNEDVVEVPPRFGAKPYPVEWPYGLPVDVEGVDFVLILVGIVALVEADPTAVAAVEKGPEVYDVWLLVIEELCMVRGELETGITGAVVEGVVVV